MSEQRTDKCEWRLCEWGCYETGCNDTCALDGAAPEDVNYRYCPYCGKAIKVVDTEGGVA